MKTEGCAVILFSGHAMQMCEIHFRTFYYVGHAARGFEYLNEAAGNAQLHTNRFGGNNGVRGTMADGRKRVRKM